jgi:hypothetical protein
VEGGFTPSGAFRDHDVVVLCDALRLETPWNKLNREDPLMVDRKRETHVTDECFSLVLQASWRSWGSRERLAGGAVLDRVQRMSWPYMVCSLRPLSCSMRHKNQEAIAIISASTMRHAERRAHASRGAGLQLSGSRAAFASSETPFGFQVHCNVANEC